MPTGSAVDVHNARVDEYNALADEVQRRSAWDDSADSVELRRRLDRAREGGRERARRKPKCCAPAWSRCAPAIVEARETLPRRGTTLRLFGASGV